MSNIFNRLMKASIYLLVFLLPLFFTTSVSEIHEFNKGHLIIFLVMFAFLAWMAQIILVDRDLRFKRTPLDLPILVFASVAVLSAIFSKDYSSSIFGYYGRFGDGLIVLLPLILLYFLVINKASVNDAKQGITIDGLLKVFLMSVFIAVLMSYFSIFGLWQYLSQDQGVSLPWQMLQNSFNPVAFSASGLAMFLSVVLLIATGLFLSNTKKLFKGMPLTILFFSILGLLMIIDYSPSWIVLLVSLLFFTIFVLWKRIFREQVNRLMVPLLLIIVSALFLIPAVSLRSIGITDITPEITLDVKTNLVIAKGAMTEDAKSVFIGSGIGTFHYDFAKFKPIEFNQENYWSVRFTRSGSHMIEILATMGVLGLLAYLSIIILILVIVWLLIQAKLKPIKSAKDKARDNSSSEELSLILLLSLAFFGLVISQLIYYQTVVSAFLFWLFLALLVVALERPIKEKKISFQNFPELSLVLNIILIVFVLAVAGFWFFSFQIYLADMNYVEAMNEQNDNQKVINNLEKAVHLNPYQSQYRITLSRAYLNMAYLEAAKENGVLANIKKYIADAVDYGKQTVEESASNQVIAWENLAVIYRDICNIVKDESRPIAVKWAIDSFTKAIELEPNNPILHSAFGRFYLSEGKINEAKQEFNRAVELKKDYLEGLLQGALIYEKEENIGEAIKRTKEAYNSYPQQPEICFQLGRLYYNNNQIDEAVKFLKEAIGLAPNYSNAHYSLAMAYQRQGNKELALQHMQKVLSLNPNNEDVQEKIEELK